MLRAKTILLLLALAPAVAAEEEASLARLLPPETPLYFENREPTLEERAGLAVYQALKEPALQRALDRLMGEEGALTSQAFPLGPGGLVLQSDWRAMHVKVRYVDAKGERVFRIQNRLAFAWAGLADGPLPVDLVAGVEVDTDPEDAVAILRRVLAAASLTLRGEKRGVVDAEMTRIMREGTHRDVTYTVASLGPVSLYLAPLGRLVVLTTTEERMRDCIERHSDPASPSLATDPRYGAMLAGAAGTGSATTVFALQVDHAVDVLQRKFPLAIAPARMMRDNLGMGALKAITSVSRVDGSGSTSTTSFVLEGDRRGLARLFEGGEPAKFGCLDFAPQETLYVLTGNFSAARLYGILLEAGGAIPAAQVEAVVRSTFGLRLREDLLDLIGPEGGVILASNQGLIPDIGLVIESPDAERLEANLLTLLQGVTWPPGTGVREFRTGDTVAHAVPLGHPRLADFPLAPTFGVVDGRLLIAPFPLSFQRFAGVQRGERPGIAENADFVMLRGRVPPNALGMSYLDLGRATEFLYDTLIPIIQGLPSPEGNSSIFDLPDVRLFSRHLFGRVGWRVVDERGMHYVSHASVDTSALVLGSLAAAGLLSFFFVRAEAMPPAVTEAVAEGPPRKVDSDLEARTCRSRVQLLRARLRLYQLDHGSALPDSIDALRAPHVADESFVAPGAEKAYVYLGPAGRGDVLLHGWPNGTDGCITILTVQLEIERVTEAELTRRLGAPGPR